MDEDDEILALWWYSRRRRNRVIRRHWVTPIVQERFSLGTFETLMGELRSDETKFLKYFRMSSSCFDALLKRLSTDITVRDTTFRECICPEQRLAICLRYFASGCSFKELHLSYRVGLSTVSKIIREMSHIIWNNLSTDFLKLPDTEREWEEIAKGFESKTNFPHCIGAVDLKYIRTIRTPKRSAWCSRSHKDYFSLLAVVDSEYRFIYISVASYEEEGDSDVLKGSTFWHGVNDGTLNLPKPRPLHENLDEDLPYVLVGDEGFASTSYLLRPYGGNQLDEKKKMFNYRVNCVRRYVQCALSVLTNKWTILLRVLDLQVETAIAVIKACTVLYNFVKDNDIINYENNEIITLKETKRQQRRFSGAVRGGPNANAIRNAFSNYFVTGIGSSSSAEATSLKTTELLE